LLQGYNVSFAAGTFGLELHLHSRQTKERIITSLEPDLAQTKPAVRN